MLVAHPEPGVCFGACDLDDLASLLVFLIPLADGSRQVLQDVHIFTRVKPQ
jgi:hypothetical protein